jgi:16S rRNA (guanine966-N2)-methyltransferase
MRVISGEARGRPLKAPKGMRTRPMADKIREAAFSMLWSMGIEPKRVLDLYAGSGSVGIEALSRGAAHATFVEQNAGAAAVIRQNLASTGLAERGIVHQATVERFVESARDPYDFIIMDPPYADPDIGAMIRRVSSSHAVKTGTVLLLGHAPYLELPDEIGRFANLRRRCHGDSCFSIFEAGDDQGHEGPRE